MDYIYATILGVVQGIGEFLPISSSGHLVLANELLASTSAERMPEWLHGMTMNVALHFGTLLSIAVVYWKDLIALLKQPRTVSLIVLASIPVGIVGLMFKDQLEALFENALTVGFCLLVTAAFLMTARKLQSGIHEVRTMPTWIAVVVGIFQAIAILPGISRAGSTVAAGLSCGLKREDAAKFSFFIAIPAIGGATLLKLKDLLFGESAVDVAWQPMLLGALVSFVVGLLSLRWLIRLLVADRLHWFALYCSIVGCATIVWQLGFAAN